MNSITLTSNKIDETLICPTSKSYANRALLWGAILAQDFIIHNLPEAQDVKDMISNLKILGIQFDDIEKGTLIKRSFPECEGHAQTQLLGSEGGTTIRFLLSLLSFGKRKYTLPLKSGMKLRPLEDQINQLSSLGAKITRFEDHLEIQGPIKCPLEIKINCQETTQFASSMQLLGEKFNFKVIPENVTFSKHYLEMNQKIIDQSEFVVPVDFSSLSYIAAFSWLNQDVRVENALGMDPFQGDSELFNTAKAMGADFQFSEKGLVLKKAQFNCGFDSDISNCLDLFPTLAYLAMFIPFESTMRGFQRLVDKESNRLKETLKLYDLFNQKYVLDRDHLKIIPSDLRNPEVLSDMPNDHRMVMAGALMLKQLGGGTIDSMNSVDKSFPNFFNIFS